MAAEDVFRKFPEIEIDDKYYLRKFIYEDAENYLKYLTDEKVNRFVPKECIPTTIDAAKGEIDYCLDLYNYKRSVYWAVAKKSDNKLIGSCGFNYWNRDHKRGEISYDLAYSYWGKGIMTKTVKKALSYAFINMDMNRVEATVTPLNKGSQKVLTKLGFKKEGVLRQQKLLHGKFHDAIMLSILQKEFTGF